MPAIDALLRTMLERGGSDLHLTVGLPPKSRISGGLAPIGDEPITAARMETYLSEICPPHRWTDFLERRDLDLAYEIAGLARFRGNYLYNHWGMAAVFRQIPSKILSFEELKLPEALKKLCHLHEGLVLVTGPTGSGKSTTLAAMIDYINTHLARHVITIEDPIEFVHPHKKSTIVHREVGEHTRTFGAALKGPCAMIPTSCCWARCASWRRSSWPSAAPPWACSSSARSTPITLPKPSTASSTPSLPTSRIRCG